MKKFLITVIMLVAFTLPTNSAAETLKIAYEPWLPLTGIPDTKEEGYAIEIAKIIFGNYKINFENIPYIRSIRQTEFGEADILLGVCDFEIDKTKVVFPKEVMTMIHPTFFVRHDSKWRYKGFSSLRGIRLGLIHGYEYVEFDGVPDKTGFTYISGNDIAKRSLRMLLKDQISAFYEDRNVVQYYASKLGVIDRIREAGNACEPLPFHIAISKKRDDAKKLADEFDAGIRQMRTSKLLDKILQKYNIADWK